MAYDDKIADRIRRVLAGHPGLTERKMMGALCFMVNGHMCCGVTGAALMVRVGPDAYAEALNEPHVRPMEIGGRATAGFVLVDPAGVRTAATLSRWIQRGLDLASTLPPKRKATPRR